MHTDKLQVDQPVHITSEDVNGIIYRLPPYDEAVKMSDTEGENGEIQVMTLTENGLYDGVLTCNPQEIEPR